MATHIYYRSCYFDVSARDSAFSSILGSRVGVEEASQVALVVKKLLANAGDIRDLGSIPGSGRASGGGLGNPLQYSCLGNSMNRGTWEAAAHRITRLK